MDVLHRNTQDNWIHRKYYQVIKQRDIYYNKQCYNPCIICNTFVSKILLVHEKITISAIANMGAFFLGICGGLTSVIIDEVANPENNLHLTSEMSAWIGKI